MPGQGIRFAGVQTFRFQKLVEAGVNPVCQNAEQARPLLRGQPPPGPRQGGPGGGDCRIDLLPARFVRLGAPRAGDRIEDIKHLAGAGTDKLASDEMA